MLRPALALLCVVAAVPGCAPPEDAEAELRRLVTDAGAAAEARNTGFFRELIAAGYADTRGYDRDALVAFIRGYFLVHDEIQVISRVEEVTLHGTEAARVVVHAGVIGRRAGRPVLRGIEGDLYRIELELVRRDGDWRLIGAAWERSLGARFH